MQPYSLLVRQKRAADRSAHCHYLACLRISQGYLGAALFYQHEAARMHRQACELREQYEHERNSLGCAAKRCRDLGCFGQCDKFKRELFELAA